MDKRAKRRLIKILAPLLISMLVVFLQHQGYLTSTAKNVGQTVQQNTPGFYQVTRFDDGDTVSVDMEGKQEKIRFIGVDTPETHDPRKAVQCFGHAAAQFTKTVIAQNRVRLEADPINSNRDRYQRLLRYVYLPDGTLVNKRIVEEGYGFALTAFPFTRLEEFKSAEHSARGQNKGLWGNCQIDTSNGYNQTNNAPYKLLFYPDADAAFAIQGCELPEKTLG